MNKLFLLVLLAAIHMPSPDATAQSSNSTLDIVSWNIEWFGASFENPANDNLQRENAKKIMRYLDADIYGLTEMVDTAQIRRLVDSLGTNFGYIVSSFCSGANSPGSNAWRNGQKLVFIYKKDIISNVVARGMLRASTGDAYYNWASGRFPFLLNANATVNSVTKNINFIVIHGKAGATGEDYIRRRAGAQELKDTLDAQFPTAHNIIFGDFNDALNQTISTGSGPASSYQPLIADSTDADHYKSITLPLAYAGQSTMINFPNVIDNHVISNELAAFYVANSAQIRTDILTVVPDYVTAHNTSDHYPVFSKYTLTGVSTSVPQVTAIELGITTFPNPFINDLHVRAQKTITDLTLRLINLQGQELYKSRINRLAEGTIFKPQFPELSKGIYFLELQTKEKKTVIKLVHL